MSGVPASPSRREESRYSMALPVKVFPGRDFASAEWTCTYQVSWRGVRLKRVPGIREVGQEIWIQRNNRRARYRVTWIGQPRTPGAEQFGAERLDGKLIWDDDLRKLLRRGMRD